VAVPTGTLTGRPLAPRATSVTLPSLTYWRVQRSVLQKELATRAGIHWRHVQRLEAGGRAGLDTVRALAVALNVSPVELMSAPPATP